MTSDRSTLSRHKGLESRQPQQSAGTLLESHDIERPKSGVQSSNECIILQINSSCGHQSLYTIWRKRYPDSPATEERLADVKRMIILRSSSRNQIQTNAADNPKPKQRWEH